jgi:drug/metabolite transporter (DMT)-like permease
MPISFNRRPGVRCMSALLSFRPKWRNLLLFHFRFTGSPAKNKRCSTSLDMTNDVKYRPSGFGNPWLQLALSVLCVFVSELLLKRGATDVADPENAFSWTGINGLASPLVWWAILLVIASFISWLYVLKYIPLAIAFPLSRVVDILVPLGCWIFLGELISTLRWCGIALVVIGLALVAKPVAQIEERL